MIYKLAYQLSPFKQGDRNNVASNPADTSLYK